MNDTHSQATAFLEKQLKPVIKPESPTVQAFGLFCG
jgi:hypothetical protein